MLKIENAEVLGWEHAIRGMRNPKNSWEKSDSEFITSDGDHHDICGNSGPWYGSDGWEVVLIGENDLNLMTTLRNAGTDHRKFMRMITVYLDITAPLYWWKEFDTYKVGTVANSCSTMHKIHAKKFEMEDFSHEHLNEACYLQLAHVIETLNVVRDVYVENNDKEYWWQMIQLLPSSYNQKRTITMNYENVMNIINQRQYHKLDEWVNFVQYLKILPYIKEIRDEEK